MKIEVLNDTFVQKGSNTNASQIVALNNDTGTKFKKFKFSYSNGNAFENFKIEVVDISSGQLHPIASITDLGFTPDSSAYNLLNEEKTRHRVGMIMTKAYEYIKLLY